MISLDDAHRIIRSTLADVVLARVMGPCREAIGCILCADQSSHLDLPPFDKSAMDGYAILAGDERDAYHLLETVLAGHAGAAALQPGTTVKVMTGAPVPAGSGCVIPIEDANEHDGIVRIERRSDSRNICPQAEDIRRGEQVLPAGHRLRALDVANLISCGIMNIEVFEPIRAATLLTGDEIVDDPAQLAPGRIMNADGPLLAGLLEAHGLSVVHEAHVRDDLNSLTQAIDAATAQADLVVLAGGASAGERDYVRPAMQKAGLRMHFDTLAIQPGRPSIYATAPGKAIFGLPGNPAAVYLTFHLLVLYARAVLVGADPPLRTLVLPLEEAQHRRAPRRRKFVPARLTDAGTVLPLPNNGPAHLLALRDADGFLVIPEGVTDLPAGCSVEFLLIPRYW